MKIHLLIFGFVLALHACPALGQDYRTVSVVGKAEFEAKPDLATLELGAIYRDRDLSTAKDKVDKTIHDVVKAISKAGIDSQAIRRSNINISTYFPDDNAANPESLFIVTRNVTVTVSTTLIQTVLQNATKAGANQVEDIQYSVSNNVDLDLKTLAAAIENAKEQARYLVEAFDSKLGKVLKIQADQYGYPSSLSLVVSAPQQSEDDDTYIHEKITVTRSVNVVFEITD